MSIIDHTKLYFAIGQAVQVVNLGETIHCVVVGLLKTEGGWAYRLRPVGGNRERMYFADEIAADDAIMPATMPAEVLGTIKAALSFRILELTYMIKYCDVKAVDARQAWAERLRQMKEAFDFVEANFK